MTRYAQRLVGSLLLGIAAACGGDAGGQAAAGEQVGAARPPSGLATAPDDPCHWLPANEAQGILGEFGTPPVRVRPGQRPSPDGRGTGCLYTLAEQPRIGRGTVTLSVVLHSAGLADLATQLAEGMFGPRSDTASGGWDHEAQAGLTYLARVGHVGVQVDMGSIEVPIERVKQLAVAVRDRVPDRPFENPVDPDLLALQRMEGGAPEPPPATPDPCVLLTRAEAEHVLGPLAAAPYRSAGDSPLGDAYGDGCSYFTRGHRVLTITRTLSDGQMLFRMAAGTGAVAANVTGADAGMAADTLEGPWDDVMQDMHGTLRFLKGDRMLEVVWVTSNADRAGALRLAAAALGRL